MNSLTERYRAAVKAATITIGRLAELSGQARSTMVMYLYGQRPVSKTAAKGLADGLDEQAADLRRHAKQLRKLAGDDPGGVGGRT